ncbi:hypothetical protein F4810DRAFT_654475 [Camillea tinctor]|nr:hypothetical protein F4810DRAFT_654475 [Camillea tinctor]
MLSSVSTSSIQGTHQYRIEIPKMRHSSSFPADIYHLVFSFLPQEHLLRCRLVNKFVGAIATSWAFRRIRLGAINGPSAFLSIAESDHLRYFVKEVTIDLWTDSDFRNSGFRYFGNPRLQPHMPLLLALPYLRSFSSLKTLNIRFHSDDEDYLHDFTAGLRCYVLSTIFSCLAGTWSPEWQRKLGHDLDIDTQSSGYKSARGNGFEIEPLNMEVDTPIELTTLTISHLESLCDERLTSLPAFKQVIESPSLRELKLLVTIEPSNELVWSTTYQESTYQFLEALPRTWLVPCLAENLQVLSLYCTEYWGWDPKMDFRTVNPRLDSPSGFPNLKVLALGNYVFSHQWQIDWIASLGVNNGHGGLQELYLDDCPIMWFARIKGSPDTTETVCLTTDGQEVRFSNDGYPRREAMLSGPVNMHLDNTEIHFDLRWHHVLSQWRATMPGLKVFKMGHGAGWDHDSENALVKSYLDVWVPGPAPVPGVAPYEEIERYHRDRERGAQEFEGTVFLNYDSVSPPEDEDLIGADILRQGVGLYRRREHVMQYVYFDLAGGPTWIERDNRRRMIDDERIADYWEERRLDEEALDCLLDTVRANQMEDSCPY